MFLCHETHANHASDANLDFSVHKLYENKAMTCCLSIFMC